MARGLLVAAVILVGTTCRLSDLIGTPKAALLAVDPAAPDSLIDSAAVGSTALHEDTISVTNEGGGELHWTARSKQGSTWLLLPVDSGTAPTPLLVQFDPEGRGNGMYYDTVVVQSTTGGALETPVRLEIHPCRDTPITLDDSVSDSLTTADCGAPHRPLGHFAQLFRFSGTINDSVTIEVPASFDAYVALDTALAPASEPFSAEDDCLGTPGVPCLYYQRLPRNDTYYIEVTSADSADTGSFKVRLMHPRRPNPPVSPEQLLNDSTTVIAIGDTITATDLLFRAVISDPDLGDVVHLEAEVRPLLTDFTGPNIPNGPAVANGQTAWISVSGLADNVSYHWRVRAGDNTGRQGDWVEFNGNPAFRIAVPHPPTIAAPNQFQIDSVTSIATNGVSDTDFVVLRATLNDQDPGDQLRLQVEVKEVGTNFIDSPTDESGPVTTGGSAAVRVGPLPNAKDYHWQARAIDQTGDTSAWISYPITPPNSESARDFRIQLLHVPDAPTALAQYQSDASTLIPVGGDASQTNVVFKGIVSDPDVGQTVRLDVEYKPVGTGFTDQPTVSSTFVTSGSQATVGSLTLSANTDYHWQARAVDNVGRPGGWVSYPTPSPNPETDRDFHVALPVTQLIFTVQPTDEVAGVAIAPAVRVTAADQFGAPVTSFTGNVTMTIDQGPAGATLTGTTTVAAVLGVATFGNLILTKMGTYVLRATTSSPSLTITSGAFNITPAPTSQLVFTTNPPASVTAGAAMTVVVTAQDAFFNTTSSFVGSVTMAIAANPGSPPGTLSGPNPVTAVNGVATFSNLSINRSGVGYTLRASSGSLTPDTSTAFTITPGPATHLGFTVQPSDEGATLAISPPIQVAGLDAFNNLATSFNSAVTMAITPGTGTSGAALGGNNPVVAVNGTATFPNLTINLVGTGYTLTASSGVLTPDTSIAFNITSVGNTRLVFTAQPTNTQAGATISSPGGVRVTAQDSLGTTVTSFTGNVMLAITAGTGTPGAVLAGTTTVTASAGVAIFNATHINRSGTGYTLTAMASGATNGTSATFNITPGPVARLLYTGQPSNTAAGAAITPPVVVTAQDTLGNTASGFTGLVTTTIAFNAGGAGAVLYGTPAVNAVGGVATFSNLRINRPGVGYTLRAGSGALVPDTSAAFNITSTATQLAFTVQPASPTAAGVAINPPVQVTAQDSLGNTATGFTNNVTVALFDNPNGGTLGGTKIVPAIGGIASFSTLTVNRAGPGYTLIATSGSLSPGFSNTFTIDPGTPSQIVFTVQPSNTPAGGTIAPPVQVTVQDNQGNTVTNYVGSVAMAIGTNPSGATLSGTVSQPVANGQATFSDLSINLAGNGYTLQATSAGVAGGAAFNSNPFSITGGMATQLVFTTQPANSTAGVPINPAVRVTARDALGNTASFTGNVTITIASGPVGGGLTPSSTPIVAAVGGVATFSNLRLNKTGGPYTLQAASGALSTTSTGFTVAPGGVSTSLSTVSASPGSVTASSGASQSTITVTARDTLGNLIPSANVVFSATGTGNTLTPSDVTDGAGVATGTLSSTVTGTKTVSVTIGGVAITQTAPVTVAPDVVSPSTSTMTRLPTTIVASTGSVTSTMTVTAKDQFSNLIPNANVVFAATGTNNTLTPNPPAGALTNFGGVATGTLSSTVAELKVGSATVNGTLITPTVNITVTNAPAKFVLFTVQPRTTAAGTAMSPAVQVEIRDTFNNRALNATNSIALSILIPPSPSGATVTGTPQSASAGIATFNNLQLDKAGTGYALLASTAGLTPDTSSAFDITPGGATKLAFFTQPSNTTGGTTFSSPVQVEVQDASGNRVTTASNSITLAIGTNANNGALSGTVTVAASLGLATFPGVSIDSAGIGYTLNATSSVLTQATSTTFNVSVGTATKLGFRVQPSNTSGGAAITPAIQVEVRDAGGNRVTTASNSVSLAIGNNVGPGALLSGTTPVTAISGVATFSGMSIDSAGTGYTLVATAGGLTQATSASFNITVGAATKLVFLQQPTSTSGGATIAPAITVEVQDAGGNRVNSSANVTLAIANNPGSGGLSGDSVNNAVSGLATFNTLSINNAGTGYTLLATASGLASATSAAFNITVGAATKLRFVQQPTQTSGGATISPAVTVEILDAGDNRVNSTANVTLAIGTNPGPSAVLTGGGPVAAVAGLATFPGLSIDSAGTGYTLVATSGALTQATSNTFNIVVGAATKLGFLQQPTSAAGGAIIAPPITVEVRDAGGNRVTSGGTHTIDIAILNNANGGTLSGDVSNNSASGLATFSDLSINNAGTGYTLQATSTGLTSAASAAFNITVGAATKLRFVQQPTQASGGATISPAVTVEILDAGDNRVNSTANVTLAIGTNPGPSAALTGGGPVAAVAGLATFSGLSIDSAGNGYTLVATSGALTQVTSNTFNIVVGAATKLGFLQQPTSAAGGATIAPPITVEVRDAGGNRVTGGAPHTIDIAILNGGGTLSGDASNNTSSGLATFSDLSIDLAGNGYTLRATSSGLTGVTSNAFNIVVGAPAKLVFLQQPTSEIAGIAIAPAITVRILDAGNNLVGTATNTIDIAILNNAGGGALSGDASNAASGGVATFSDLSIDKSGTGYTLQATSGSLTAVTSTGFDITPAAAVALFFTVQPSNTAASTNMNPAVVVTARDQFGNTATGFTGAVTLDFTLGTNGESAGITGNIESAIEGVATFNNLQIDTIDDGSGYTLDASAVSVPTGATSNLFFIL